MPARGLVDEGEAGRVQSGHSIATADFVLMDHAGTREKGGAIPQREAQFVNGIHLELDRGHDPEAVHANLADNDRGVDAEDVARI